MSSIEKIVFPPLIEELNVGWCCGTPKLTDIEIPIQNKNFCLTKEKFILGKSSEKSDNFDVLYFVPRDIKEITLPFYITEINHFALSWLEKLTKIDCSKIENNCLIQTYDFSHSYSLEEIYFPRKVDRVNEGWFSFCEKLNMISIPSENKRFTLFNEKVLLYKSNENFDFYDVLVVACRDIENINIPSSVKHISSHAFSHCRKLKTVTFESNSQLKIIDKFAFFLSSIKSISLPSSVTQICENAFSECYDLESIEIPLDSQLNFIGDYSFSYSSI